MKKILLITTGGTIASIQTKSGLIPGIDGKNLIDYIPNIKDKCEVDVKSLFNEDFICSKNLSTIFSIASVYFFPVNVVKLS